MPKKKSNTGLLGLFFSLKSRLGHHRSEKERCTGHGSVPTTKSGIQRKVGKSISEYSQGEIVCIFLHLYAWQ